MATCQKDPLLLHLRGAMLLRDGAGSTDGQLLESFITHHDEAAFAALVRRHGPMVWGVCRRLLRNTHDAEDAFQATFLVLVRKAASVVPRERVPNWLYGVAYQTAVRARSLTAKRQRRERQVMDVPEQEATPREPWNDLQPVLDQELAGLPERYRLPVVLCDLEGKTRKAAARQLGWPEGTVSSRLARARALLAKRLTRHGLAFSGAALGALLAQQAAAGVPAPLVSMTVKNASLIAAGSTAATGALSARVVLLTEGVLKAMLLTKLKTRMMAVLVLALMALGGGICARPTAAAQQVQVGPSNTGLANGGSGAPARQPVPSGDDLQVKVQEQQTGSLTPQDKFFLHFVGFVDTGTVYGSSRQFGAGAGKPPPQPQLPPAASAAPGPRPSAMKGDLGRLQGVWAVVSMEGDGKRGKPEKVLFMVDGNRVCWQARDGELQGGLYLDATSRPKAYDIATSTRTFLGIYALNGDTLRLCYDMALEPKRPTVFATEPGSQRVLVVLRRLYGPEGFPFRLADGTRAFPKIIDDEEAEKALKIADFYHRTGHPETAQFYRDVAKERKVPPPPPKPRAARTPDDSLIQGTWKVIRVTAQGKQVEPMNLKWKVANGKIVMNQVFMGHRKPGQHSQEATYRLGGDPTDAVAVPASINMTLTFTTFATTSGPYEKPAREGQKTFKGIYAWDGKQLTLCFQLHGDQRPTAIPKTPGKDLLVFLLAREQGELASQQQAGDMNQPSGPAPVTGKVEIPWLATGDLIWDRLGLKLEPVGQDAVTPAHLQLHGGLRVVAIRPTVLTASGELQSSPAVQAKIKVGDILVGLHQWETLDRENVLYALGYWQGTGNRTLDFYVVRNKVVHRGTFTRTRAPATQGAAVTSDNGLTGSVILQQRQLPKE
jgi:RNA polymerase sigma factor (sigma-70 family)